jgi:hypothetical protein
MIKALPDPELNDLENSLIEVINNYSRRAEKNGEVLLLDHVITRLEVVKQIYILEYIEATR